MVPTAVPARRGCGRMGSEEPVALNLVRKHGMDVANPRHFALRAVEVALQKLA